MIRLSYASWSLALLALTWATIDAAATGDVVAMLSRGGLAVLLLVEGVAMRDDG